MILFSSLLAAIFAPAGVDPGFVTRARAACAAPVGREPRLPGIRVTAEAADPGDLPRLRVTDAVSGGWMYVHYDPGSAAAARARAACVGAQLRLLDMHLGGAWPRAQWASAVFTREANYIAPMKLGVTRWVVPVEPDGRLGADGRQMVVTVLPHEQVHAFQRRVRANLPRWMGEGHAEWVGRKVAAALDPREAAARAAHGAEALRASTEPVALARWGSPQVTRAAIMRQVSPEERRRMESDPKYNPPSLQGRSFRFEGDDIISDESNTGARYEAAWRVFHDLDARHGEARVRAWANGLWARPGTATGETILTSAREALGEDLAPRLR